MPNAEPREELAEIAASLRAYLEWQVDCGSSGIPRRPRTNANANANTDTHTDGGIETSQEASVVVVTTAAAAAAPSSVLRDPNPPSSLPSPPSEAPMDSGASPVSEAPASFAPMTFSPESISPPTSRRKSAADLPPPPSVVEPRPFPILAADVASCTKCVLHETRAKTVFARGNPGASLCFVGEAPGADEDESGLPFVGRAGQLLDKMIRAMGLDPEQDVYVCNIIKCRPPGNRPPERVEIETCIPYLHEQIALVSPKVIVALGNTSIAALLGAKLGVSKVRGSWKLYRGKIPVMPTYHPSYLLRAGPTQSEAKRQTWEDLQAVMKELGLSKRT